jgi:mannose-6-phosphate isomerase-like protein (cupin superfamily)
MEKINIQSKYKTFKDHWSPHSIAELNGQQVLLAKVKGVFVWHSHKEEDELFHVIKGKLKMEFIDKAVEILPGEMIMVPKGVEHRPSADEETWILLFEPISTKHTGEEISEITKDEYPKI